MPDPSSTPSSGTTFTASGTVAELVIDQPGKRNPVSAHVLHDILKALHHCSAEGRPALVLRGAEGFFSSGADMTEVTGTAADGDWFDLLGHVADELASCDTVTIAAIEGGCIGSGLDVATACDIRIAGRDAYFALPALELGLVYRPEAFRRIAGLAGPSVAMRLAVLGERVTATEAHRQGLVSQLAEDATAEARDLAERLATLPADALLETVRMITEMTETVPIAAAWARSHRDSLAADERRNAVSAKRSSLGWPPA